MNIEKDDNASHTTDISEMMLDFVSKEGSNSYPTVTVLMNRLFLSIEDYDWRKNSDIKDKLPDFKEHDDIHWYKTEDMYSNIKNAILNNSILSNSSIFISDDFALNDFKKIFKTNVSNYITNNSNILNKIDKEFKNIIHTFDTIIDPKDILSYNGFDFVLCNRTIYRISSSNELKTVYTSSVNLNAFDLVNDNIVVASDDGGIIFDNITASFNNKATIRYVVSVSSESSGGSTPSETTEPVTMDNNLPIDSKCTFVYAKSQTEFDLGDTTTSGTFVLGESYTIVTEQKPKGIIPKSSNTHYNDKNFVLIESGMMYDKKLYNGVTKVDAVDSTSDLIYVLSDNNVIIFAKDISDTLIKFSKSNGIPDNSKNIIIKNDDIYLYSSNKWMRSINSSDELEPTFAFLCFNFDYEQDNSKDKIDIQYARMSINTMLSMISAKSVYDKYLGKTNGKNTSYIISFSKNKNTSKTAFNLFGTDDRRKKAEEMKMCCNAFDIGE